MQYSGTVAAATKVPFRAHRHRLLAGIRRENLRLSDGCPYARQVVEQILAQKHKPGSLFNVNIPVLENGPIKGVAVLPQNATPYIEKYTRRKNPRGRTYFWTSPEFDCPNPNPDTDVAALAEQFITITPLTFDRTDPQRLEEMKSWKWQTPN
ncbi:MAG: hypothetical protein U0798_21135 [Gemmataceae bacterium]